MATVDNLMHMPANKFQIVRSTWTIYLFLSRATPCTQTHARARSLHTHLPARERRESGKYDRFQASKLRQTVAVNDDFNTNF